MACAASWVIGSAARASAGRTATHATSSAATRHRRVMLIPSVGRGVPDDARDFGFYPAATGTTPNARALGDHLARGREGTLLAKLPEPGCALRSAYDPSGGDDPVPDGVL